MGPRFEAVAVDALVGQMLKVFVEPVMLAGV
jgi:hypothetical protein